MTYVVHVTIRDMVLDEEEGEVKFSFVSTDTCLTPMVYAYKYKDNNEVVLRSRKQYLKEGIIWKILPQKDSAYLDLPPERLGYGYIQCRLF